jgi:sigma-B regulation protein RsbU (phosphoserine phosphatase)
MNSPTENPTGAAAPSQGAREETLDERAERLDLAVRSAGLGTWSWEFATDTLRIDARTHELLGLEPGTFSGQYEDWLALVHPEDRGRVRREVREAVKASSAYDTEYRVLWRRDGSCHSIRARGKFYCDDSGQAVSMAGACWDVTDRRRVEEELAHERQLLGCLMANIPDKIYFKDLQSRFIRVSDSMIPNFAVKDASEIVGKNDFDFFSEEHARQAYDDEQRVIHTGEPMVNKEEKETWGEGRVSWVSSTKMPLYAPDGRIVGTFGLSRDVTARKLAEEALLQRNAELRQDLAMARELQAALLPQQYPRFPHDATPEQSALHFRHFFNPSSEVSGDFFDILRLSDTRAGVFICDVMGHGVRAALVAAIVRTLVEESQGRAEAPGDFLRRINLALRAVLRLIETPIFVSAFYAIADLTRGEISYANAGHPHPLCLRREPGAAAAFALNGCKPGPALGLFDGAIYTTCSSRLAAHDVVMLFTDGLYEVENAAGEHYDERHLRRAVERRLTLPADRLCGELVREIQQFSASKDFTDDVCLVTMEVERVG